MKKNPVQVFILSVIIILNISCIHYYYAPNANNVPLFKEKNEVRIQAQSSAGNSYSGFDIQTAYAVTNHTAVQLNIFHAKDDDDVYGSGKGTYAEVAGGYYKLLRKKHLVFETYSGIGIGNVQNIYKDGSGANTSEEAKTSIAKFFVQPSFGFTSRYFDIALSSKFSLVATGVHRSTLTKELNAYDFDDVNYLKGKSFFFWEPGVMIRGGFKNAKILLQATYTAADKSKLSVDDTNISLGITIPFKIK